MERQQIEEEIKYLETLIQNKLDDKAILEREIRELKNKLQGIK